MRPDEHDPARLAPPGSWPDWSESNVRNVSTEMPRRNNRPAGFEPLDLTSEQIVPRSAPRPTPIGQPDPNWRAKRDARISAQRMAERRQHDARINGGIDWSVCLVPGCGEELLLWGRPEYPARARDHKVNLPLCSTHLAVAYNRATAIADVNWEVTVEAHARFMERRDALEKSLREDEKKRHIQRTTGEIYYVRLNGLIKVGWSRQLHDRLRAYGPDVEVLAHYPATRDDETNLHRQLTPFRAKGREWYRDCPALHDFVAEAVSKWGKPTASAWWSEPKEVIKHRKRSA